MSWLSKRRCLLLLHASKNSQHTLVWFWQVNCALTSHHKVQDTSESKLQNQKLIIAADLRFSLVTPSFDKNSNFFLNFVPMTTALIDLVCPWFVAEDTCPHRANYRSMRGRGKPLLPWLGHNWLKKNHFCLIDDLVSVRYNKGPLYVNFSLTQALARFLANCRVSTIGATLQKTH